MELFCRLIFVISNTLSTVQCTHVTHHIPHTHSGVAGVLAALCGSQIRRPPFKDNFLLVRFFVIVVHMPLKLREFLS